MPASLSVPLFLSCGGSVEELLADEVRGFLPQAQIQVQRGGVSLEGGVREVMMLNLQSRLAQRVLIEVATSPYKSEDDLYAMARSVDWGKWISPRQTLRVDATAQRAPLRSLNFAALRVKDAVCDVMREATGERPSINTRNPHLQLRLHLGPELAALYVDSTGEPLFKRGWRQDSGDAPLKETLAAAMLAAAGWRGTPQAGGALHDPCCGSATIAIEAAQIACGVAPGLQRCFAFENLSPFTSVQVRQFWQGMKNDANARIHASAVPIYASDVAFRMVDFARRNAERAGVEQAITFNGGDVLERPAPELPAGMPGTLMLNPPYGERIDVLGKAARPSAQDRDTPLDFFQRLAAHWKRSYTNTTPGWTAWVLSPDMKLPSSMRLKESRRMPMWNGPIECRLFRFELVAGTMREPLADSNRVP